MRRLDDTRRARERDGRIDRHARIARGRDHQHVRRPRQTAGFLVDGRARREQIVEIVRGVIDRIARLENQLRKAHQPPDFRRIPREPVAARRRGQRRLRLVVDAEETRLDLVFVDHARLCAGRRQHCDLERVARRHHRHLDPRHHAHALVGHRRRQRRPVGRDRQPQLPVLIRLAHRAAVDLVRSLRTVGVGLCQVLHHHALALLQRQLRHRDVALAVHVLHHQHQHRLRVGSAAVALAEGNAGLRIDRPARGGERAGGEHRPEQLEEDRLDHLVERRPDADVGEPARAAGGPGGDDGRLHRRQDPGEDAAE